jgi:hypothetical protein
MAVALLMVPGLTSIGGLVAVACITLASIQLVVNLNDLYSYYIDGNPAASEAIITNAVIGLAGLGILAVYRAFFVRTISMAELRIAKTHIQDAKNSQLQAGYMADEWKLVHLKKGAKCIWWRSCSNRILY